MPLRHRFSIFVVATALVGAGNLSVVPWSVGASQDEEQGGKAQSNSEPEEKPRSKADDKIVRSDAEWRKRLTREQYRVTRRKGTETPFKGAYWKTKTDGIYQCVCCGLPLFDSKVKFDSKTGWPSFWEPIDNKAVTFHEDRSQQEVRTEVQCRRCDAHLGHVFSDGPLPTGQRFCMNSVALKRVNRPAPPEK